MKKMVYALMAIMLIVGFVACDGGDGDTSSSSSSSSSTVASSSSSSVAPISWNGYDAIKVYTESTIANSFQAALFPDFITDGNGGAMSNTNTTSESQEGTDSWAITYTAAHTGGWSIFGWQVADAANNVIDASTWTNDYLVFYIKADATMTNILKAGIQLGNIYPDVDDCIVDTTAYGFDPSTDAGSGSWHKVSIPLADCVAANAGTHGYTLSSDIGMPFFCFAMGPDTGGNYYIDDVRWSTTP
ncbi:MAG: hypothetical protein KAS64_06800 [Spirochaetes bacterium]|nr:hypothetical protein [Spirochaetota bacterium]